MNNININNDKKMQRFNQTFIFTSSIKKFLKNLNESPSNTVEIAFGSEGGAAATVATLASLGTIHIPLLTDRLGRKEVWRPTHFS